MNRREALVKGAAGMQWILDQASRPTIAVGGLSQAGSSIRGPRPWDVAVPPELTIGQTEIAPGADVVHLRLRLDRDPFMTVRVILVVADDQRRGFPANAFAPDSTFVATWSPGDDLDHYVSIPINASNSQDGWRFRVVASAALRQTGWEGADRGRHFDVVVKNNPAQPNILPAAAPRHRAMHRLSLGTPAWNVSPDKWRWSRFGGGREFRTSLQYGDGPANRPTEKGLYANADTYPGSNPHQHGTDEQGRPYVRLHTRKFANPVEEVDLRDRPMGDRFAFQAAWLSAQGIEDLCAETGVWELEYISPSRRYAWAAFWLTGVANQAMVWPPEIDIFEHFNGVYGDWNTKRETSSALHYGDFGRGRAGACGAIGDLRRLVDPGIDLTARLNKHQCMVTADFITIFFDGIEIVQFRHILKPVRRGDARRFQPIMSIAVAPPDNRHPYDDGSGDMVVYGLRRFDLDQVALET